MEIKEIKNDDLDIKAFKMKNDCKFDKIEYPFNEYLAYNFAMCIIGPPGSGKSTIWLNMLTVRKKLFYKKFDKIFIFSPSLKTIQRKIQLPEDQIFDEYTSEKLDEVITSIKGSDDKCLIVLDDCISDIKSNDNTLFKLILNRRHIGGGVSVMLITQVFNKLALPLRKMMNCIIMFKTTNKKEILALYNDFILIEWPIYNEIIKYVYNKPHSFLLYFPDYGEFFSNFNHIVIE